MSSKPQLSFWQIWNMSFGFLGIQFGFALQNANVSRIFSTLGASVEDIPILWLAAPLTGLIVQPIIGYASDHTWGKLGRRRPYFLGGAILASIALIFMPNSWALWVAAGMLWILDASINVSMEPFRAFVGDMLPDKQRTAGFAMQSFFIGIGAVVASALPYIFTNWLNISNTAPEGIIPPSVKWSFYVGAIVFFLAVLWTVLRSKEYSPEELEQFEKEKIKELSEEGELQKHAEVIQHKHPNYLLLGFFWVAGGAIVNWFIYSNAWQKELYILGSCAIAFGALQWLVATLKKNDLTDNGFVHTIDDLYNMPKTMAQLAVVQFFTWFALFAMWIYTTGAVTAFHYGSTDTTSQLYNDGADWVGWLFAIYNGFAALAAIFLPMLAKVTSRKVVHFLCLLIGALGLFSFYLINDPVLLQISMVGVGIAWASILSMPYAILSGSLPAKKMGLYMGIFNFFIVIPQIVAASILGFFVKQFFGGEAIYALMLGAGSMALAGLLVLIVEDKEIALSK